MMVSQYLRPLLARGRDRLETSGDRYMDDLADFPYSLGDAIDWKLFNALHAVGGLVLPYSLGDAIDWKHKTTTKIRYYE